MSVFVCVFVCVYLHAWVFVCALMQHVLNYENMYT